MVRVLYQGRLGNNMFQYAFGRLLAERLGYALSGEVRENYSTFPLPFPNTWGPVKGLSFMEPVERINWQRVDLDSVAANSAERLIELDGYFQWADYYAPHCASIRQWFMPTEETVAYMDAKYRGVGPDDLLLYVRLGDYGANSLSPQFYLDIIERIGPSRVFIATDSLESGYFQAFRPFSPTFIGGISLEDLLVARYFKRVVLSCSAFSWWASFLADCEEIHFPIGERWFWSEYFNRSTPTHAIDLRLDDKRYSYYYNCPLSGNGRISSGLISLPDAVANGLVSPETAAFHRNSTALCYA